MNGMYTRMEESVPENFIYIHKGTEWGHTIFFTEKSGKSMGQLYWYEDDFGSCFFSGLFVNEEFRRQGNGKMLLSVLQRVAIGFGFTTIILKVKKKSFMYDWYKREGFSDYWEEPTTKSEWMRKMLK